MRFPDIHPEDLAEVLHVLQRSGHITVVPDPNDPDAVLVSAAPRLVKLIEERGVTLADIAGA